MYLMVGCFLWAILLPGFARAIDDSWYPYPTQTQDHPGGGPWGGSVTKIITTYDINGDPEVMWASTRGGIYKSFDGGGTWLFSSTGLGSLNVMDIAVSASNPDILIAAVSAPVSGIPVNDQGGGVYLSTDGGVTWSRFSPDLFMRTSFYAKYFTRVAIDPEDSFHFFAACNNMETTTADEDVLFESLDGGQTWLGTSGQPRLTFTEFFDFRVLKFGTGGTVYFSGAGPLIYQLNKGAQNASVIAAPNVDPQPIDLYPECDSSEYVIRDFVRIDGSNEEIFTAAGYCGLWHGEKSAQNNWSWEQLVVVPYSVNGFPAVTSVAVDEELGSKILYSLFDFQGLIGSGIFESNDSGITFTAFPMPEKHMNFGQLYYSSGYLFAAEAASGIYRKIDGGTLTQYSKGMNAFDADSFDFNPGGNDAAFGDCELAVAGGNGVVCGGVTLWTPGVGWGRKKVDVFAAGRSTSSITYQNPDKIWVALDGFQPYSGQRLVNTFNWKEESGGDGSEALIFNNVTAFAFNANPYLPEGTAHGNHGALSSSEGLRGLVYMPKEDSQNNPYYLANVWTKPGNYPAEGYNNWLVEADPFMLGAFYVAGSRSGNGAYVGYLDYQRDIIKISFEDMPYYKPMLSPVSRPADTFICDLTVSAAESGVLLAGTRNFGALFSEDGGASWSQTFLPDIGFDYDASKVALGPRSGSVLQAIVVDNDEIFVSGDRGANWHQMTAGVSFAASPFTINDIKFSPDGRALIAAVANRGLWQLYVGDPPEVTLSLPVTLALDVEAQIDIVPTDADPGDSVSVEYAFLPDTSYISGTQAWWTPANTPPLIGPIGDMLVTVGETLSLALDVSDPLPFTQLSVHASDGFYTTSDTFTINADDPLNGTPQVSASGTILDSAYPNPAHFDSTLLTFDWTPQYDEGGSNYQVTFTAEDGHLAQSSEALTITVNRAPEISFDQEYVALADAPYILDLPIIDPDGDALTLLADELPSWLTLDAPGRQVWGTPPASDGTKTLPLAISATDIHGVTRSGSTGIYVNRAPVLDPIGAKVISSGELEVFTVNATDPDGDVVAITLDNLPEGASFDGTTFTWMPAISQPTTMNLIFTATDSYGATAQEVVELSLIPSANITPVLAIVGDKVVNSGGTISFNLSAYDPDSQNLSYRYVASPELDGASLSGDLFTWTAGAGATGSYQVTFTVSDEYLAEDSETVTIRVNEGPVLSLPGPLLKVPGDNVSFTVTATDIDGAVISATKMPSGATFDGSDFSWIIPVNGPDGERTVEFRALDRKGAESTGTVTISVSTNQPPVLAPIGDKLYNLAGATSVLLFEINASDKEGDTLDYSLEWADPDNFDQAILDANTAIVLNTSQLPPTVKVTFYIAMPPELVYFNTPDPDILPLRVVVTERDSGRRVYEDVNIIVYHEDPTQPNSAPQLVDPGPKAGVVGRMLTFMVYATDADGDPVTITASGLPPWATFVDGLFSGTPAQTTPYTVTFTADDDDPASGSGSIDVPITVSHAPHFIGLTDQVATVGEPFTFDVIAADDDGDGVTISAVDAPPPDGNFLDPTFTWNPVASGSYTTTFTASDGVNEKSREVLFTANSAPYITGAVDSLVQVGENVFFSVEALDPDNDQGAITLMGAPATATFDGNNFSWIPAFSEKDAVYNLTFSVSDEHGLTATAAALITVNIGPDITSATEHLATIGTHSELQLTAEDANGDDIVFSLLSAIPQGVTFDAASSVINFDMEQGSAEGAPYTITVQADDGRGGIATADLIVTVNSPPTFTGVDSAVATVGRPFSVTVPVYDIDDDEVTITLDTTIPAGMTYNDQVDPVELAWTPTTEDHTAGGFAIGFTAIDGRSGVSTHNLQIIMNVEPRFSFDTSLTANLGDEISHPIVALDDDGGVVNVTAISGIVDTMSFAGGVFSWTPDEDDIAGSPYRITFRATDEHGISVTSVLTITLLEPPAPSGGGGGGGGGCFIDSLGAKSAL
ncbi:MAG: hypothetical protein C0609_01630 [Deltaproteobacteria bacterium]|nr:MAG: hypothetical protein C0609_01630 [Deltaproteobacteria bacterium]